MLKNEMKTTTRDMKENLKIPRFCREGRVGLGSKATATLERDAEDCEPPKSTHSFNRF